MGLQDGSVLSLTSVLLSKSGVKGESGVLNLHTIHVDPVYQLPACFEYRIRLQAGMHISSDTGSCKSYCGEMSRLLGVSVVARTAVLPSGHRRKPEVRKCWFMLISMVFPILNLCF